MTERYRVDVRISAKIEDIPVDIDPDAPGGLRSKICAAVNELLDDRLTMLDLKGSRSGADGFISAASVTGVVDWDLKS